jgi:chromosome segregation protein
VLFRSLKTKKAEQSINSRLSRSSSTKAIKGLAKSEIDESMDFYAVLKNLHGSSSTKFKKIRTPDWVFEELHSARVEFQLTQTIEKLHDQVETSKIEIATLNQLSQSAPQTQEIELAQSAFQVQSEELERLQTFSVTLEAERDSAQSQTLLLHSESEKQRKKIELSQSTLQTQSEELARLQTFATTLEAERDRLQTLVNSLEVERDSAQSQALSESAKVRKLTSALSAVSVELADKIAELNRSFADLASVDKDLASVQGDLERELIYSQRLNEEFQRRIHDVIEANNIKKNLEIELSSIKSSRGYRLISKYWKIKAKLSNVF